MTRPLRVLFVAPSGRFRGGVERHVHDLGEGLRARGHEVALAIPKGAPRDPNFVAPFVTVTRLEDLAHAARGVDVVYAHKPIHAAALVEAAEVAPVVVAVHDHDLTCARSHRYLPVSLEPCHDAPGLACVTRGCCVVRSDGPIGVGINSPFALRGSLGRLARAARFVAASRYLADGLVAAGVPSEAVTVIHPATRDAPVPITPAPSARTLAFAGQIVRGKGLDILLRALVDVQAQLVVAGDGGERAELVALAHRLGIAAQVHFLGAVRPADMPQVYDAARVVVVPSRWPEPFGMIGVEAMRRGRVVVGARHGGIPEWLEEGRVGHAFAPGDAEDLAATLRRALADTRYEERARAGLELSSARFSFEGMVSAVEETLAARCADAARPVHAIRGRAAQTPNVVRCAAPAPSPFAPEELRIDDMLRSVLACPACHGAIDKHARCAGCGHRYDIVGGRPMLMLETASKSKENSVLTFQAQTRAKLRRTGLRGAADRIRASVTATTFMDDRVQVERLVDRVTSMPRPDGVIVDVGAGEQHYRADLERLGRVLTIDVAPYGATDVLGDGHRMPLANESVAAIASVSMLEHLARPWVFFAESARVLRRGGVLFGVAPQYCPTHGFPNDFFRFTRGGIAQLAAFAGLELVEAWPIGGPWATLLHWYWANHARESRLRRIPVVGLGYHVGFQALAALIDRIDARDGHGATMKAQEHNDHVGWSFIVRRPD